MNTVEWHEPKEEWLNDDVHWRGEDGVKSYLVCFKNTDNDSSSYDDVRNRRYYEIATWYATDTDDKVKGWYFPAAGKTEEAKPKNFEVVAYADIPKFNGEYA